MGKTSGDLLVTIRRKDIRPHRKVTIELAEVREAMVGTVEISISTTYSDMGTVAKKFSPCGAQPQDNDSGKTYKTTTNNGTAEFLGDV